MKTTLRIAKVRAYDQTVLSTRTLPFDTNDDNPDYTTNNENIMAEIHNMLLDAISSKDYTYLEIHHRKE
jgi:hypothetical protein